MNIMLPKLLTSVLGVCCSFAASIEKVSAQQTAPQRAAIVAEILDIVEQDFYDPDLRGLDATALRKEFVERSAEIGVDAFPQLVNEMLGRLKTSHTAYFPKSDPRHYQLLGIFEFLVPEGKDQRLFYEGIGVETDRQDGRDFVRCVYDGTPAATAGILYGDEIVSLDGQPWRGLKSLEGKSGQTVLLHVRRQATAEPIPVAVDVETLNGRTLLEDALRASVRKYEIDGHSIGYLHLWSYAGSRYHEIVKQQLLWGDLKDCDAIVLDLRDGWGGASLEYLNIFREPLARTSSEGRQGQKQTYDGVWARPVVLLVNEGSTSGKEMLSFVFQKHGFGQIVGSRTAGAVMAGSPRLLANGDVLYLAVANVWIDEQRLEGKGVEPAVVVERPLPYAAGADPQLERALETAAEMIRAKN